MARAAAAPVAEAPAPAEEREIDFAAYKTKAPTDLQERLDQWLRDKCDITPADFKSKDEAFSEGVRLAVALRIPFQASPENRRDTAAARAAREAEKAQRQQAATEPAAESTEAAPAPAARRGRPAKAAPASAPVEPPAEPAARGGRRGRRAPTTDRPAAF